MRESEGRKEGGKDERRRMSGRWLRGVAGQNLLCTEKYPQIGKITETQRMCLA